MFRIALRTLTTLALTVVHAVAAERPNILFIQTDDQAAWAIGVADRQAVTPNIDKLFKGGAWLKNSFVVTPVCSPSRASLMTSRYGSELGITDWIHPRREPKLGLDPSLPVWPKLLQKGGYKTGLVGKWHLGLLDSHHPTKFGFDEFMGHRGGGWSTANPTLEKEGGNTKFEGLTTDILADHAIDFLERHASEPFLLCWHTRAPHTRWLPVSTEDRAPYEKLTDPVIPNPDYPKLDVKRVKNMTRDYLSSVRGVDRNVGRVLAKLDQLGLSSKTVVIFTSDHGYNMGHNGIWHKGNGHWVLTEPPPAAENIPKGQRPNMYDASIKVPTAVRWPGVVKPGTIIENSVSNLDWFPTLLSIAGVEAPGGAILRGRDFSGLLKGEPPAEWSDDVYAEYSTKHQSRTHMRMYRSTRWKLVRDFLNEGRDEFYDLQADPAEAVNLIASKQSQHREAIAALDAKIREKMTENGDPAAGETP